MPYKPRRSAALTEFDARWDVLIPKERERLVYLLTERIVCSPTDELRIVFRTNHSSSSEACPPEADEPVRAGDPVTGNI